VTTLPDPTPDLTHPGQTPLATDPPAQSSLHETAPLEPNPLLERALRIPFHRIRAEHVVPGVRALLEEAGARVEVLANDEREPDWENTLAAFDEIGRGVGLGLTPVHQLLAVAETPELRSAWTEVLPEVSRFFSRLYLDGRIWGRMRRYAESPRGEGLTGLRRRHLDRTLRDFRRSGADLPEGDRAILEGLDLELAQLQRRFSEHVLDATAAYTLPIGDRDRLGGIPADALDRFRARAEQEGLEGWILTLDQPSLEAVLRYADDRSLREEIASAHQARGTLPPHDNLALIPEILSLRTKRAHLLGYPDFPDFRLEEHMVGSGARARGFLEDLAERTRPYWERDFAELRDHARTLGIEELRPWDTAYVAEQLRRTRYDLDEEQLRPYFPLPSVLEGLFGIVGRLFGLRVVEVADETLWHPDARSFELWDEKGTLLGLFYADLHPRPEKRQGAWMADFRYGGPQEDGEFEPHVGVICANFPPPGRESPSLLTHRDVETLFHEFGHLLHHLTSRVPIEGRGGIHVAWDWVELPSQLLENWSWEEQALHLFARHWKTGEPLPQELFEKMLRARRFQGGWRQMRQLGFGTLDLALHGSYRPGEDGPAREWVTELLLDFAPDRHFAAAHPLPSFTHLFAGGYAAAYYSYMWAEVLEADLFTRFQERGIFDRATGEHFLEAILTRGDAEDPAQLYRDFMGRDPDPGALLRRNLGAGV